jgi:hypothetical protein
MTHRQPPGRPWGKSMNRHPSVISTTAPSAHEGLDYRPDPNLVAKARVGIAVMKAKRDHLTIPTTRPLTQVETDISTWFIEDEA